MQQADEEDELSRDDDKNPPLSVGSKSDASSTRREPAPPILEEDDELQPPQGENQAASVLGFDESGDVDKTHQISGSEAPTHKTPSSSRIQSNNGQAINNQMEETPLTYSVEARYIPRDSFQPVAKLNLAGEGKKTKPTGRKLNAKKTGKQKKSVTKNWIENQGHSTIAQGGSSSMRAAEKRPTLPAIQRLQTGRPSALNRGDHSPTTMRRKFQKAPPILESSTRELAADIATSELENSQAVDDSLPSMPDSMQSEETESPANQARLPLQPVGQAPVATMTVSQPGSSGTGKIPPITEDYANESTFIIRGDDTLANSPADWRPATQSFNLDDSRRKSPLRPSTKTSTTAKKRKARSPTRSSRDSSSEPAAPATKRGRISRVNSIPVTIYRLSRPLRTLTHDPDSSSDSEDLPDRSSSTTSFKPTNAPNAIDVFAQVTTELLSNRATILHTQAQSRRDVKTRRALERQRNAVVQFQEEVEAHLFTLTEAVHTNVALAARLRAMEKEKLGLRRELVEVKKRKEEIGVEMDEVRAAHAARMERVRERMRLQEGMEDVEVAVRRGREAEEKGEKVDGEEGREWEMARLEGRARRVAEMVSSSTGGGGLLDVIKRFNEKLEKAAEALES